MGSSSTVCSEASAVIGLGAGTFARPPPLSSRWTETWIPRELEFKGWNPDLKNNSGDYGQSSENRSGRSGKVHAAGCPKVD